MTQLITWDDVGEKFFETGVDHGVLYVQNPDGSYPKGVAWNGLVSITESPSGAEPQPQFADNIKYLNLLSAEDFGMTIEAFTYPPEFEECDGGAAPELGIKLSQQPRKSFGLCYRTIVGNDVSQALGYKYHLVYSCVASPSEKNYSSINESPEAITFSWDVTTTPAPVTGFKPTALITIDSTKYPDQTKLNALLVILYGATGTPDVEGRLPLPNEIMTLLAIP